MIKRIISAISMVLSFAIGTVLVLVFGVHKPMMAECSERSQINPQVVPLQVIPLQISPRPNSRELYERIAETLEHLNLPSMGSVNWSGTVNGQANVVIRRSSLSVQRLTGIIETDCQNFTSPMPTAPMKVTLRQQTGTARILLSPDASNGYVTIVRVEGSHGQAAFTLNWSEIK